MNQLELPRITNMNFELQSNSQLLCPQHGETIEVLILDEKMKTSQTRSGCEKCIKNQSYRLISLTQAKKDHFSGFQKVYSEIKNKLQPVENIYNQLSYIEKNRKDILSALEIITNVYSMIINNYNQLINKDMQFNSVSELEIFAEYIAKSKFRDEQQRICENYINKFHKNIEEELKKELNQLNIQCQLIINIIYSFDRKINQIGALDQESIKSVNKLEYTAFNNLKSTSAAGFINIKCSNHYEDLVLNMDSSIIDDKKRVLCKKCVGECKQFQTLERALFQHQEKFTEVQNKIIFQESAFIKMLLKNLNIVIQKQKSSCKFFQDIEIQFNNVLENLDCRIQQKKTQIFNISDQESMINFAKEHFEIFYSGKLKITDQFNEEILSKHNSEIESLSNQLFEQFSRIFDEIQQDYNQIQDLMRFKLNFLQINKALVGQFNNGEHQYIQFNLDDRQLNFLQNSKNLVQYSLKVEKSHQQFIKDNEQQEQQLATNYYKDFRISQDSSWFVVVFSKVQDLDQIQFWLQNGSSYKSEDPTEVQRIESLEIDSIHDACISFHQDRFMIWRKNTNFKYPQTIQPIKFIQATFNKNYTLLVLQEFSNGNLEIFQFNSDLKNSIRSNIKLASIQEDRKFKVWFLEKPKFLLPSQFLITFQEGRLLFHKIDLRKNKNNQSIVIQQVYLETGEIIFCQHYNIFAFFKQQESVVSLYVIKQSEKNVEKFTISKFSMIYEFGICIEVKFSQRGRFISIISGENLIHIYCIERLPRLFDIYQGLASQKIKSESDGLLVDA